MARKRRRIGNYVSKHVHLHTTQYKREYGQLNNERQCSLVREREDAFFLDGQFLYFSSLVVDDDRSN